MKIFTIFLCSFILLTSLLCTAEIIEINDLNIIKDKIEDLPRDFDPEKILIILAIENTLLRPSDDRLLPTNPDVLQRSPIIKKALNNINLKKSNYLTDIIFTNYAHELIDKQTPKLIKKLQEASIPVIAIVKGETGKLSNIARLEVYKANYLKKLDIDLSTSFKSNDLILKSNQSNKQAKTKNIPSIFYNGIITYSNGTSISSSLVNFLFTIKFTPQIIIMIDYEEKNLAAIEQQMRSLNSDVKFIGYHYTAIDQIESKATYNDQQLIDFWYKLVDLVNKAKY